MTRLQGLQERFKRYRRPGDFVLGVPRVRTVTAELAWPPSAVDTGGQDDHTNEHFGRHSLLH